MKTYKSPYELLSDDPSEVAMLKLKGTLVMWIAEHIRKNKIKQKDAATLFGVTQPRVSNLMNGQLRPFALDSLIKMAITCGYTINIEVKP